MLLNILRLARQHALPLRNVKGTFNCIRCPSIVEMPLSTCLIKVFHAELTLMFTASTPSKRLNTRASAASRRSQSRASSVIGGGHAESPLAAASSIASLSRRGGRRASIASSATATGHDARDEASEGDGVDALESRGILLQTSTHSVSRHVARIPAEVQHLLRNNGRQRRLWLRR